LYLDSIILLEDSSPYLWSYTFKYSEPFSSKLFENLSANRNKYIYGTKEIIMDSNKQIDIIAAETVQTIERMARDKSPERLIAGKPTMEDTIKAKPSLKSVVSGKPTLAS